jgi:outer membrane receptor protein involved in Fe transport
LKAFFRMNNFRETSNGGDFNRPYINPGFSAQYNLTSGKDKLVNHISLGADYQSLFMTEHSFGVKLTKEDTNRVDTHFSEETFDTGTILRNQIIKQKSLGVFFIDKLDISKKLYANLNVRYDYINNELIDNLYKDSLNLSGNREFKKPTFRFGLAYDACKAANIFVNVGTGFLSPTNDELYNNPVKWGGFNMTIEPSTSLGEEFGIRGNIAKKLYYDITAFSIVSKNEFYRYREPWMGNTSAVYGNIGESNRTGLETYFSYSPVEPMNIAIAYTYSHFRYTSPDSVKDHWIPQCPAHMLAAEVSYKFHDKIELTISTQYLSKWCIQVDDSLYDHYTILEAYYPTEGNSVGYHQLQSTRSSWVDGYNLFSVNLAYYWKLGKLKGELSLFVKNITDVHYFGFTEPNNGGDYNSYQAAPGREIFASLKIKF